MFKEKTNFAFAVLFYNYLTPKVALAGGNRTNTGCRLILRRKWFLKIDVHDLLKVGRGRGI